MYGVTRLDRVNNEYTRGSLDVAERMREIRLRWFGHIKRRILCRYWLVHR